MEDNKNLENLPALYDPKNLPAGITADQWKKILEVDLKRSMEDVIPRLEQIRILHAGALMFKFPLDETGKDDCRKDFNGIVADSHRCRAWWEKSYQQSGGGQRPDCSSLNAIEGSLFGKCSECEYSKDGTGKDGEGTACKLMKRVHLFIEGHRLPFRLTLTITSIPIFDDFSTALMSKGFPIFSKILHFSLDAAVSKKGIPYSKLHLSVVDQVDPANYLKLRDVLMTFQSQIRGQEIIREEYEDKPDMGLEQEIPEEDRDPDIEKDTDFHYGGNA